MSVQLIVFPQTPLTNEFVVDGTNFNTINTSDSYDSSISGNVILDVITNQPPSPTNTWFRFRTTSLGTPTLPTETSSNLTLYSTTTLTFSGVYQKLSNLVVGATYEMTIDLSTTGTGSVLTSAYNGTTLISQPLHSANLSQITFSWTAASTDDTIVISYYNGAVDNIVISNISVSQQGIIPTTIYTALQDGQVICDLYEDEDIPLTLNVDNFKNVAEKVQSYSKAFNLPATKRNNQIFDNIFEITRTDTGLNFNPYKRTKAILKQDGFLLFEGYLRMIDISDKLGEISYNVNLYSEVVALADVLGDKTFSDLDFSELEHDYNLTNIQATWTVAGVTYLNPSTSGFRAANTVKYPFVDWTHQYTVNPSSGFPVLPNLESSFRPFLNIKYLIDRIFKSTDFTYESTFFDTVDFKKLYMDFNWGSANTPVEIDLTTFNALYVPDYTTSGGLNYATTSYSVMELSPTPIPFLNAANPPNYNNTTEVITSTVLNETYNINYSYSIENTDTVSRTIECQWLYNSTPINYSGVITIAAGETFDYTGSFTQIMTTVGDTLLVQFRTNAGTASKVRQADCSNAFCSTASVVFNLNAEAITTNTLLQTLRGELGQWDFLKGIMTMFNLVTLPDENNPSNIKIEPYGDIFLSSNDAANPNFFDVNSTELNWTEKIDVSEMKLIPLTELNKKTIFKFVEDDDDYAFMNYKNSVGGHLYGSKKFDAWNEFNILEGEEEIVAEPFAATVIKPLMEQFSDFITPAIYSYNSDDNTSEGFENSPRIMYNNGEKTLTSCTYFIPPQNGVGGSAFEDEFLQFSHLSTIPTTTSTLDFHFGECQLIQPVGSPVNDNLFNLYWLPYYSELYNPDTRTMTIKVNLSPSDINTFRFFDTVMIKNRTYRVNNIDYKPNDLATVEFILLP